MWRKSEPTSKNKPCRFFRKLMKNENFWALLLSALIAFVFLFSMPINPWTSSDPGTDDAVFKTEALMMQNGYMPYRDSFDHKGPLIYIINFLGNSISYYRGFLVIEFIFFTFTFFFLYKIARLACRRVGPAIIATFAATPILFQYVESNLTETYALLFITLGLYIFLDYLINQKISRLRLIICGISLGAILCLRPNMIAVWAVFSIATIIKLWREKDLKKLRFLLPWFLLGVAIILTPIIIWLAINGALIPCWEQYIVFNKAYSTVESRANYATRWNSFFTFAESTIFLIAFSFQAYISAKKKHPLDIAYLILLGVSLLLICLSGQTYSHYGSVIVPLIAYPIARLFEELEKIQPREIAKVATPTISIYLLAMLILPSWIGLVKTIPTTYKDRNKNHYSSNVDEAVSIIRKYTDKNDRISVYGNWNRAYVLSKRLHATKYSYQKPIGGIAPEIYDEYFAALKEELPKVIIVAELPPDDKISSFLDENNYRLEWSGEDGRSNVFVFLRSDLVSTETTDAATTKEKL